MKVKRVYRIDEAFNNKRMDKGQVGFSKSDLTDPHVIKIIQYVAQETGLKVAEIEKYILNKAAAFNKTLAKSPMLNSTVAKNMVESTLFNIMWAGPELVTRGNAAAAASTGNKDLDDIIEQILGAGVKKQPVEVKQAPKFDLKTFMLLNDMIKQDHSQFFPLRNFVNHKYVRSPRIIMVPSSKPADKQWNDVDTAACAYGGIFIYNTEFMQRLLDFGFLKGIKPKGKKYVCNGGKIPNEYAYIEFLIIHEYMHYTYADNYYQKKLKADGQVINIVGDLRSNYILVKSGYEQLPIGLYSDDINFDRQRTYKEMYDAVLSEMDKLPPSGKKAVSGEAQDDHSKHEEHEDVEEEEPTEAEVDKNWEEIDDISADIEDKIENAKDSIDIDPNQNELAKGRGKGQRGGTGTSSNRGRDSGLTNVDWASVKPKFSWKQLISRFVASSSSKVEETYAKLPANIASKIAIGRQIGSTSLPPGEIKDAKAAKAAFCVDSSGSMHSAIPMIYANIYSLSKSHASLFGSDFYLYKFSNDHYVYKCNMARKTYVQVKSALSKSTSVMKSGDIGKLFGETIDGGTAFNSELAGELIALANQNFNVMLCSDSDILGGDNFKHLKNLLQCAGKKNVFIIFESKQVYTQAIQMLGFAGAQMTYFDG